MKTVRQLALRWNISGNVTINQTRAIDMYELQDAVRLRWKKHLRHHWPLNWQRWLQTFNIVRLRMQAKSKQQTLNGEKLEKKQKKTENPKTDNNGTVHKLYITTSDWGASRVAERRHGTLCKRVAEVALYVYKRLSVKWCGSMRDCQHNFYPAVVTKQARRKRSTSTRNNPHVWQTRIYIAGIISFVYTSKIISFIVDRHLALRQKQEAEDNWWINLLCVINNLRWCMYSSSSFGWPVNSPSQLNQLWGGGRPPSSSGSCDNRKLAARSSFFSQAKYACKHSASGKPSAFSCNENSHSPHTLYCKTPNMI